VLVGYSGPCQNVSGTGHFMYACLVKGREGKGREGKGREGKGVDGGGGQCSREILFVLTWHVYVILDSCW